MANGKTRPETEVERITLDDVLSQGPVPSVREVPQRRLGTSWRSTFSCTCPLSPPFFSPSTS